MKTYDLGIITAVVLIGLALVSAYAHDKKKDCPACAGIEQAAEAEIDHLANLPQGTASAVINAVD